MTNHKPVRDSEELPVLDLLARALNEVCSTELPVVARKTLRKLKSDVRKLSSITARRESGVACSHCFTSDRRDGSNYCDECECLNSHIEEIERDQCIIDSSKSYDERMSAARRRMARQGGLTLLELKQQWKRREY